MRFSTVILDLDGPLLDVSRRHHYVYSAVCARLDLTAVPFDEYWVRRREGLPAVTEMPNDDNVRTEFARQFAELIETPDMLALDSLQPNVFEALSNIRRFAGTLVLCTLRTYPQNVTPQLVRLNIFDRFDAVVVAQQPGDGATKADAVKPLLSDDKVLWIGDTPVDIDAARLVVARAWAVSCGIRNESFLARANPDKIFDDLHSAALHLAY